MTSIDEAAALAADDNGLAFVATARAGTIQSSLINAATLSHPATDEQVLAFVTYGKVKLANLRTRPQIACSFRRGWDYATVEGEAEIAGPDDPQPWLADAEALRVLLRNVFTAAGGTHDDWEECDRVMVEERRAAVLIRPRRVYSNR